MGLMRVPAKQRRTFRSPRMTALVGMNQRRMHGRDDHATVEFGEGFALEMLRRVCEKRLEVGVEALDLLGGVEGGAAGGHELGAVEHELDVLTIVGDGGVDDRVHEAAILSIGDEARVLREESAGGT